MEETLSGFAPAQVYSFTPRSEEHTSELQSRLHLVCRLLLEKKKIIPVVLEADHGGLSTSRHATRLIRRFPRLDPVDLNLIYVTFKRVDRTLDGRDLRIWPTG